MRLIAILCALTAVSAGFAADQPDPRVKTMLDRLDLAYEVDQDNDYGVVMKLDGDRTQSVYILSGTNIQGDLEVREIWSYGYLTKDGALPADLSEKLMNASRDLILGSWELAKNEETRIAVLVVKLPVTASLDTLRSCIETVAVEADKVEQQLNAADEF